MNERIVQSAQHNHHLNALRFAVLTVLSALGLTLLWEVYVAGGAMTVLVIVALGVVLSDALSLRASAPGGGRRNPSRVRGDGGTFPCGRERRAPRASAAAPGLPSGDGGTFPHSLPSGLSS